MAMTQDEIRDFWKLGVSLLKIPKDINDPQIEMARGAYDELKRRMVDHVSSLGKEEQEIEIKDFATALNCIDAVLTAFISLTSMIPQLAGDSKTAEVIDNGKAASKWLHANLDSLKNSET